MAKSDSQSQSDYPSTRPYQDQRPWWRRSRISPRRLRQAGLHPGRVPRLEPPGVSTREIKGALRRYFEADTPTSDTGSSVTGNYE